ncbi:MAG: LytTR family DNA-binding domain-containing protein [Pseudomonadota bacterium]
MNGQFSIGAITPSRFFVPVAVVLGVLFALISTRENEPLGIYLVQWQLQSVTPMLLLIAAHTGLLRMSCFARLNPWAGLLISGLIGASLFTPFALLIDANLLNNEPPSTLLLELAGEWVGVAPPISICWVALNAPWVLGYRLQKTSLDDIQTDAVTTPPNASTPPFLALVSESEQGSLVSLKAELHYLMVTTTTHRALILYNISDAIEQLETETGFRVHRSYWVAKNVVSRFEKKGREGVLTLIDGQQIPVSRNRLASAIEFFEL